MDDVYKSRFGHLAAALILSVCLVGGIPAIVFGAVKGITVLLVFGIICTVAGFYGCPIAWVNFAACCANYSFYKMITEGGIHTVRELASLAGISESEARAKVKSMIRKNWIGKNAVTDLYNDPVKKGTQMVTLQCPSCGAKVTIYSSGDKCPYCGTYVVRPAEPEPEKKKKGRHL